MDHLALPRPFPSAACRLLAAGDPPAGVKTEQSTVTTELSSVDPFQDRLQASSEQVSGVAVAWHAPACQLWFACRGCLHLVNAHRQQGHS